MKLTAYVPCHNGETTLPEVLQALRAQTRGADQYLLVNDRSTDRSVEIARQSGFEVEHTGPVHFGLAAARNVALEHARGDILACCDADAAPEPNFLAELEGQFARHPDLAGLCGCLQERYAQDSIFDLWRSIHMRQHYGNAEVVDPPILFGCSGAHRTAVLRLLGGWDPRFTAAYDDKDLTLRIRQAGGRTLYAPTCKLWHIKHDTLDSVLKSHWNWNFPPPEFNGDYASPEAWLQRRLREIWDDYGMRRRMDLETPQISLVTCVLPWAMIIRDLHHILGRLGQAIDLNKIVLLAHRILVRYGANPAVAEWIGKWLRDLVTRLPALTGPTTRSEGRLLAEIERAGLISIPDGTYWSAVQSVFTTPISPGHFPADLAGPAQESGDFSRRK